ncbi:hypothetical protein FWH30_01415 [Microgenomates group bacterium]|nr:hypothetical protein [Microgenomates group bacterium]
MSDEHYTPPEAENWRAGEGEEVAGVGEVEASEEEDGAGEDLEVGTEPEDDNNNDRPEKRGLLTIAKEKYHQALREYRLRKLWKEYRGEREALDARKVKQDARNLLEIAQILPEEARAIYGLLLKTPDMDFWTMEQIPMEFWREDSSRVDKLVDQMTAAEDGFGRGHDFYSRDSDWQWFLEVMNQVEDERFNGLKKSIKVYQSLPLNTQARMWGRNKIVLPSRYHRYDALIMRRAGEEHKEVALDEIGVIKWLTEDLMAQTDKERVEEGKKELKGVFGERTKEYARQFKGFDWDGRDHEGILLDYLMGEEEEEGEDNQQRARHIENIISSQRNLAPFMEMLLDEKSRQVNEARNEMGREVLLLQRWKLIGAERLNSEQFQQEIANMQQVLGFTDEEIRSKLVNNINMFLDGMSEERWQEMKPFWMREMGGELKLYLRGKMEELMYSGFTSRGMAGREQEARTLGLMAREVLGEEFGEMKQKFKEKLTDTSWLDGGLKLLMVNWQYWQEICQFSEEEKNEIGAVMKEVLDGRVIDENSFILRRFTRVQEVGKQLGQENILGKERIQEIAGEHLDHWLRQENVEIFAEVLACLDKEQLTRVEEKIVSTILERMSDIEPRVVLTATKGLSDEARRDLLTKYGQAKGKEQEGEEGNWEEIRLCFNERLTFLGILKDRALMEEMQEIYPEMKPFAERIERFREKYNQHGKAETIIGLVAYQDWMEELGMAENLENVARNLEYFDKILEQYQRQNVPEGSRTSIGMEYEMTQSLANNYKREYQRDLKGDMQTLANEVNLGQGNDAVFEIATHPTDNPYLMLLEMYLLQEAGFIDLNFNREGFEKAATGMHLTIGGETGIDARDKLTFFMENILLMSNWAGVNAGKEVVGDVVSGGRRQNSRERSYGVEKVFENNGEATEIRVFSIDSWEPFERVVLSSYYGGIALQTWQRNKENISLFGKKLNEARTWEEFREFIIQGKHVQLEIEDEKERQIISVFLDLLQKTLKAIEDHNENFLMNETSGYIDRGGFWVGTEDFRGEGNRQRFEDVAGGEEQLREVVATLNIDETDLFQDKAGTLMNQMAQLTNLFIKPSSKSGGDRVNARAILDNTKLNGVTLEEAPRDARFQSVFDRGVKKERRGYYNIQGGSERMIIHAIQQNLLEFKRDMEAIVNV